MAMESIMLITILFMSLLYLAIGYGINKDNAKYLIAGYNTMESERQEKFDIEGYLNFFKPFFKKLSLFPPITYGICYLVFAGDIIINVWSFLQIAPFIFFMFRSRGYE